MVQTNLCPKCYQRYHSDSHLCSPSALDKARRTRPVTPPKGK